MGGTCGVGEGVRVCVPTGRGEGGVGRGRGWGREGGRGWKGVRKGGGVERIQTVQYLNTTNLLLSGSVYSWY